MTVAPALRAQEKAIPVIGFMNASKPVPAFLDEFCSGLAENGCHEGQNVVIEHRWAEGQYDRLAALAAELVLRFWQALAARSPASPMISRSCIGITTAKCSSRLSPSEEPAAHSEIRIADAESISPIII